MSVRRSSDVVDEGQQALVVETPAASWVYHKEGGGFSSLLDADGRDWLGYRPGGGPAGEYRGIPNMVFRGPDAGFFHPGHTGTKGSVTEVVTESEAAIAWVSTSGDGAWRVRWDVFADHARLRVLAVDAADPGHWFLYEGTPGGTFQPEASRCLRSTGADTPLTEAWDQALPAPAWVAFTDPEGKRSLVLCAERGDRGVDMYRPMPPMTVFGFGRAAEGVEGHLRDAGHTFRVGLVEAATHEAVADAISQWMHSEGDEA